MPFVFFRRRRKYFTRMYFCAGDRIPTVTRGVVNGATQRKRVLFLAWHYCVQLCIPLRNVFLPCARFPLHCKLHGFHADLSGGSFASNQAPLYVAEVFLSCVNNALLRTPGASLATRANDFRRKKKKSRIAKRRKDGADGTTARGSPCVVLLGGFSFSF